MKKVFLLSIICLSLVGCNSEEKNLNKYDNDELQSKLKKLDEVDYDIKTPSLMPFNVKEEDIDTSDRRLITITFKGENDEKLDIQVAKQPDSVYQASDDEEMVMVGDEQGKYLIPSGRKSIMVLKWNIKNVSYDMGYYNLESNKEISKKDFIKIAESFED
jgi:uncharacterized protein YacL (UPF0231 family)